MENFNYLTPYKMTPNYYSQAPLSFGEGLGVRIFPNPVSQNLSIHFQNQIPFAEINVLNVLGETVLKQNISNSNNTTLNVANLTNGIYFIQIKSNNILVTKKFIKN